jgi:hypothetical protein
MRFDNTKESNAYICYSNIEPAYSAASSNGSTAETPN